jgi:septal ring factor EnvC (AmiA/AmiB activator)
MLRRLLGPVWEREQTLFEEIDSDLEQVRREIEELRARDEGYAPTLTYLTERLDALDRQVRETAALGWDHAALVRRLSVLEDRLQAQPVEGADADAATG